MLLAGCANNSGYQPQSTYQPQQGQPQAQPQPAQPQPPPPPPAQPTLHYIVQNHVAAVAAGTVGSYSFEITGAPVDTYYQWTRSDDSAVDTGFIRASDLAEYKQGQTVNGWAINRQAASVTDHATLPVESYAYIIKCDNSFADCDGTFSIYYYA